MEEANKLWEAIKSELSFRISTVSYDVWFSNIEPLTIYNNKLVVVTKLQKEKTVISTDYKGVILDIIKALNTYVDDFLVITPDERKNYTTPDKVEPSKEDSDLVTCFNSNYTFENFVVGPSNQIVYAAAKAVAENPNGTINPLFIYGGVGLGKTHIIHSIGNEILHRNPKAKILYATTEQFVNDFIDSFSNASSNEKNKKFREKYRNVDVLMLDDIQFLANKTSSQEALFHTFNDLYEDKKQIVISSDRHPKELTFLEDRLRSRFQCGLSYDITKPDIETKIAILKKKAADKLFNVSQQVIYFLADRIDSNIRELEGALNKVYFYCQLQGIEADSVDVAQEALKDDIDVSTHIISIDSIVSATCNYFNVKKEDVIGKKKLKPIVHARQIAVYLVYDMLSLPLVTIGNYFGGRDYTTIIYTRDKMEDQIKTDKMLQIQVDDIKNIIQKR